MPDVFTKRKRSEVMARIRGRGNKGTELALAKLLRVAGITGWRRQQALRFRSQRSAVSGQRPTVRIIRTDFIFRRQRVAVFVDGCFWHGCPKHCSPLKWIRKSTMKEGWESGNRRQETEVRRPRTADKALALRTGKKYWRAKLAGNKARDLAVNRMLRQNGWRVVRIWEHELGEGRLRVECRGLRVVERIRTILR